MISKKRKNDSDSDFEFDFQYDVSLKEKAKKLRIDTFNAFIKKGEAHLGGSFSCIEIFSKPEFEKIPLILSISTLSSKLPTTSVPPLNSIP